MIFDLEIDTENTQVYVSVDHNPTHYEASDITPLLLWSMLSFVVPIVGAQKVKCCKM